MSYYNTVQASIDSILTNPYQYTQTHPQPPTKTNVYNVPENNDQKQHKHKHLQAMKEDATKGYNDLTDFTVNTVNSITNKVSDELPDIKSGASMAWHDIKHIGSSAGEDIHNVLTKTGDTIAHPMQSINNLGHHIKKDLLIGGAVLLIGGYLLWHNTEDARGEIWEGMKNVGSTAVMAAPLLI